jgi:transcriptional regulator with XRE-family HTH domain
LCTASGFPFVLHLARLRRRRALTQVTLAQLTGMPCRRIQRLEESTCDPRLSDLLILGKALNVPVHELFSPCLVSGTEAG